MWKRSSFYHTPLHSTPPLVGFPSEYRHPLWYGKTRMVSLPDGEKISKIFLFVLAQLRNVTDRQTDGRTPGDGNSRAMHSIARQKQTKCEQRLLHRTSRWTEEPCYGFQKHTNVFMIRSKFFFYLLMTLPYTAEIASLVPGGVQGHTRPPTILHRL